MACVYKQGWCLQTGMRGVGEGGGGWRCWTYVWRPAVSSHRAATPSTASSVVFLSFCPQPPIPLTIPTHHAPHSKNQARAGTISTNHTTLSILSGRTRRVLDFFAYNTTSFADVVKTLVCTMFFASGVYEFMLLWTSCIATPFPVYEQMVCSGHVSYL